jgi:uncharacterized protein
MNNSILTSLYQSKLDAEIKDIFLTSGDNSLLFYDRLIKNKFLVDDNYDEKNITENIFNVHSGTIRIDNAYFFLTDSCNLDCEYCLVKKPEHKKFHNKTIDFEQAKKYIDYFFEVCDKNANEYTFTFYGGEPLLKFDLLEKIITEIRVKHANSEKPLKFIALTNGLLITGQILDKCLKNDIHLVISIDGDKETTKDQRFKGKENHNYEVLLSNIKKVQKKNVSFGLSCTIGIGQENNAFNSFNYLVEKIGATNIGLNYIIDIENYPKSSKEYADDLTNQLIKIHNKYRGLNIYEDRLARKVKAFTENNPVIKDCTGCGSQIVFTPNNKIGPCQSFALNEKYFSEFNQCLKITETSIPLWNNISPFNKDECLDCVALGFCGGGCPYRAHNRNGSIESIDDIFCIHSKKLLDYFIHESFKELNKSNCI